MAVTVTYATGTAPVPLPRIPDVTILTPERPCHDQGLILVPFRDTTDRPRQGPRGLVRRRLADRRSAGPSGSVAIGGDAGQTGRSARDPVQHHAEEGCTRRAQGT